MPRFSDISEAKTTPSESFVCIREIRMGLERRQEVHSRRRRIAQMKLRPGQAILPIGHVRACGVELRLTKIASCGGRISQVQCLPSLMQTRVGESEIRGKHEHANAHNDGRQREQGQPGAALT